MNPSLLAMLGWPEIIGILVVVLILFGAKKLPDLAKGLGQGIREFKKASRDVQNDLQTSMEEEAEPPKRKPEPKAPKADSASSESEPAAKA
jgi:sec-independent protein translocase protein TatA